MSQGLKRDYLAGAPIRDFTAMLLALAFVPVDDVVRAFEILVPLCPEGDAANSLLEYFEVC